MPSTSKTRRPYIMVVDDESDLRAIVSHVLEHGGYEVAAAENGQAALRLFAQRAPDLVILDGHLPDLDGFEVCRRLRADPKGKDIPILLCTVRSNMTTVAAGLEAGATDYVVKPFSVTQLLERVANALAESRRDA